MNAQDWLVIQLLGERRLMARLWSLQRLREECPINQCQNFCYIGVGVGEGEDILFRTRAAVTMLARYYDVIRIFLQLFI